jgi:hypothetical protein
MLPLLTQEQATDVLVKVIEASADQPSVIKFIEALDFLRIDQQLFEYLCERLGALIFSCESLSSSRIGVRGQWFSWFGSCARRKVLKRDYGYCYKQPPQIFEPLFDGHIETLPSTPALLPPDYDSIIYGLSEILDGTLYGARMSATVTRDGNKILADLIPFDVLIYYNKGRRAKFVRMENNEIILPDLENITSYSLLVRGHMIKSYAFHHFLPLTVSGGRYLICGTYYIRYSHMLPHENEVKIVFSQSNTYKFTEQQLDQHRYHITSLIENE